MLYLIRTHGRGKKTSLKVGFTEDISKRKSLYREQNPFYELLSTRLGDEKMEMYIHLYLESLGYKEKFLKEWFIDCPEVLEKFHSSLNKIQRTIWINRDKVFFDKDIFQNNLKLTIYEDLRFLHRRDSSFKMNKEIDKSWKSYSLKKILKNTKNKYEFRF